MIEKYTQETQIMLFSKENYMTIVFDDFLYIWNRFLDMKWKLS